MMLGARNLGRGIRLGEQMPAVRPTAGLHRRSPALLTWDII